MEHTGQKSSPNPRCLWPRCQIRVLVRVDSQVCKPPASSPRLGENTGLIPGRSRGLSEAAPRLGDGRRCRRSRLHRAKVLLCFLPAPNNTPGCTDSVSTKEKRRQQSTTSELLPRDCIDRGGLSLQRKVRLGRNFSCKFSIYSSAPGSRGAAGTVFRAGPRWAF